MIAADVATPLGPALLVTDAAGAVLGFNWYDDAAARARLLAGHAHRAAEPGAAPANVLAALDGYWSGDLAAIDAVPVAGAGTAFQRRVWAALRTIPAGTTTTYGALARTLGGTKLTRAVGLANGANPVGVFVPCHRVIGSTGALTGYAGGLDRKRWLLTHERAAGFAQSGLFD